MFTIIAAIGKNNELGKSGNLIWHLPNDLKFFKAITTGKKIVMGRKTYNSLPKKLPNREHYVITSKEFLEEGINIVNDVEKYISDNKDSDEEIFVIGGGAIYTLMLPFTSVMYLTEIDSTKDSADVYFPTFNKEEWIRETIATNQDNGIKYKHVKYVRK